MYAYVKALRLNKADDFSSVFILGTTRRGTFLKIHYKPNEFEYSRLGLIVSKKIHKRANKRNYMKRVIRELFRQAQIIWVGHDVIVRAQKCFTLAEFSQVSAEFNQLTRKLVSVQQQVTT